MKKILTSLLLMAATSAAAQRIALPAPDTEQKSASVVEALRTRHSVRSYTTQPLSLQQISNLCWAACGQSRGGKFRTAPTAMNRQEIRLYVFTAEGAYEYLPADNQLLLKASGDHRALVAAQQDFVKDAPVSLVMVIDFEKFGSHDQRAQMMACVDAGNVSQNVNLYCQSVGLATVPRASMDAEAIRSLLGLGELQLPIMNNPVGVEKKS